MNIYLQPLWRGTLAQLVEQRTENPCVPGSIPGGTTKKSRNLGLRDFLFFKASGYIFIYLKESTIVLPSTFLNNFQKISY